MDLYNLLKHLQRMKMLRNVKLHDPNLITITFNVPLFVYSTYEDFFKEFGYVISDIMITQNGTISITVRKDES